MKKFFRKLITRKKEKRMSFEYCPDNNAYLLKIKEQIIVLKSDDAMQLQKMINDEINRTPVLDLTSAKDT